MKNNFIQRAVTGVLFVIVLVGCILYSPLSFGILFTIISVLSVHEFAQLVSKSSEVSMALPFLSASRSGNWIT